MATKNKEVVVQKYSKKQLISSKRYNGEEDIINAVLQDNKLYSIEETDALVENFMKGKVK